MSNVRDVRGRYIDADKLITTIDSSDELDAYSAIIVCDLIENESTADVRENVHGEWRSTDLIGFKRCSVCEALWHVDITGNLFCYYCPKCGAKMRKGVKWANK